MPIPLAAAAIGGSLIGGAANVAATNEANQANAYLYSQQFKDSVKFWKMQNEYNSPAQQMNRLKDAGLNPNLVYGNGNAITPAQPIKMPDRPDIKAPDVSALGEVFSRYMEYTLMDKKKELMDVQKGLYATNALVGQADYSLKGVQTENLMQDISQKKEIFPYQLQAIGIQNEKSQAEIGEIIQKTSNLISSKKLTEQQVDNAKQALLNMKIDYDLKGKVLEQKEWDNYFKSYGVDSGLSSVLKPLVRFLDLGGEEFKKVINLIK